MVTLSIIRDNREQKPWTFDNFDVEITGETINTGDYTLKEFCSHDQERDTYYPDWAIERKAGQDFLGSITNQRERFLKEVKRAADWDSELLVLIEEPKRLFKRQRGFMKYRDVAPSQIFGTVDKWERYYNVNFRFTGTRERAQQIAYDALQTRLRASLMGD